MRVLLLGKQGMLGSAMQQELSNLSKIDLVSTSKTTCKDSISFDVLQDSIGSLVKSINPAYIVNCIGTNWNHGERRIFNVTKMFKVNSLFPRKLVAVANSLNVHVIQILTDGVFSGKKGFYHENSRRDDHTLYGQSKKFGETSSRNVLGLRCSLIGEQSESHNQYLLEWLKSRPRDCTINGYENYIWNGVTTNAFSRIVSGIINSESKIFGSFHLNPSDYCSKFDLLKLLADKYTRTDIRINQSRLPHSLNRTLTTNHLDQNSWFWKIGKYPSVPSIGELVNEI